MDHVKEARRLRKRAEECRLLAELSTDACAREGYGRLAESYLVLADNEQALSLRANCPRCDGGGWICAGHPERPWTGHLACGCGATYVRCPDCTLQGLGREQPVDGPSAREEGRPGASSTLSGAGELSDMIVALRVISAW